MSIWQSHHVVLLKFANQHLQHYFKVIASHYKILYILLLIYIYSYIDVKQSGNKDNAEKYQCHLQFKLWEERRGRHINSTNETLITTTKQVTKNTSIRNSILKLHELLLNLSTMA